MIGSKAELRFYIMADRIMNGLPPKETFKEKIRNLVEGGGIVTFLKSMRCVSFYKRNKDLISRVKAAYYSSLYRKLGIKLGFSIGYDALGYGVVIPHHGTIVVGGSNRIGNYAVLHTSTCVSAKESAIGEGLYLSTGAKITQKVQLGDGVMIAANSVVNKSFDGHELIVGAPAKSIKKRDIWYREEPVYLQRVEQIESLKEKLL